jgi:hypothetical protein
MGFAAITTSSCIDNRSVGRRMSETTAMVIPRGLKKLN